MTVGTKLPEFDLSTSGGGRLRSSDLAGSRTVLYFYPKDDTPGCTVEGQEFSRLLADFQQSGVTAYGVSPDSAKSHEKFIDKCSLSIPLISDPDRVLIGALGLWVEKHYMGRTYMGVQRSTFMIGPDGTVEREWRQVKPAGHAAEVLEAARSAA
jgi:thioredoxin-dependent peroxiredoxin